MRQIAIMVIITIGWGLATISTSANATVSTQTCLDWSRSTPSRGFINHGNGTITHIDTKLMWMQCSIGQDSRNCGGSADRYTWQSALTLAKETTYAGYEDWRLPTKKELKSIVENTCHGPSINLRHFPNTCSAAYWTGSSYSNLSYYAWYVSFLNGNTGGAGRESSRYIRLVRNS